MVDCIGGYAKTKKSDYIYTLVDLIKNMFQLLRHSDRDRRNLGSMDGRVWASLQSGFRRSLPEWRCF